MENISILGFYDPVSSLTHYLAALGVVIGSYFLIARGRGNKARVSALIVFSFCQVFLFSMSGTFHLLPEGWDSKYVLKVLDHAAIWTMIAGSFTPIHVILMRGLWRWGFLAVIWTIAITGLVLKTVYFSELPYHWSIIMYLGLGWMGALSFYKVSTMYGMRKAFPIILGGALYTFGAIIEFANWPVLVQRVLGPHELFHIFVVLGASSHWTFVYLWANQPVHNQIFFEVIEREAEGRFIAQARGENLRIEAKSMRALKRKISYVFRKRYRDKIHPESVTLRVSKEESIEFGREGSS